MENTEKSYSVSEYIDFLNGILNPQMAVIQGEVGEKIGSSSKAIYFKLLDKEDSAMIDCMMWQNVYSSLGVKLEPGKEIQVLGYPDIYKNIGKFSIKVRRVALIGEGDLKKQFEALKKKLKKEGLFAPEAKKPIPRFPENIGLITSKYGRGAKKDFLTHLEGFGIKIEMIDARVEGLSAVDDIKEAIDWFNKNKTNLDLIVLTRGGGSWESLQAFNSEEVSRSIFASKIPIITGVGHEDDTTIADLVSDKRASTPTDAAKIIVENWKEAKENLPYFETNLNKETSRKIKRAKEDLDLLFQNIEESKTNWLQSLKDFLKNQEKILKLSSPDFRLKQGYTITSDTKGNIIKNPQKIKEGDKIKTQFHKGQITSKVEKNG